MNDNFVAINMDIQHSRKYNEEERAYIQQKLFSIIKFINKYYANELVKKFEFSLGDSIQALFNNVPSAFSCYCLIRDLFYPYQIKCGIGYGKLNKKILDKQEFYSTNMLEGKTYHYAHYAMDNCRLEKCSFLIYSGSKEKDNLVNQIMRTVQFLNNDLTNKQADVFDLFNLIYPLDIKYEGDVIKDAEFIINILRQNILSYNFDKFTNAQIKELVFNKCHDLKKEETIYKIFEPAFSTALNNSLSVLLSVSRQNVEKMRNIGKFDEIRNLEHVVLEYMKKEYNS